MSIKIHCLYSINGGGCFKCEYVYKIAKKDGRRIDLFKTIIMYTEYATFATASALCFAITKVVNNLQYIDK